MSTLKQSFFRHELIAVLVGVLSVLSAAGYWRQFEASQNELRASLLAQADKRAVQMAEALGDQAALLLGNTDFALRELRDAWVASRANFDATVRSLQATYPDKSVVHVAVIGADGYVVFSTRGVDGRVFAGDREHFKIHADRGKADTLHVSKPLYGRVSKDWNILISRPILRTGGFFGVMIIGLSPKYISEQLAKASMSPGDAVVLLHRGGEFLARSPDWESALGKSVQADRPFLAKDAAENGVFRASATLDQKPRIFGWHRLRENGLILVAGLDQSFILEPFDKQYAQELTRILAVMVVMLILGSSIALLLLRLARRQDALRASEERWKFALEGAGDGVWDWNVVTNKVAFSRGWKAQLGYTEEEIGDDLEEWSKRVHPEDIAQVMADLQPHLDGKTQAYANEHRMLCKDGSWKWILDRGMVVRRAADGKALRVIGTHSDISERRRADDALRESESKYRRLIESSPDIVYVFSSQRGGIFYSPRVEAVLGYKSDEFYARPFLWAESIHLDDVAAVKQAVASAEGGKSFAVEYRIKDARGHWHWFLDRSTEVHTANGELLIEGLVTDITERKNAERRLAESEHKLSVILESVDAYIYLKDTQGRYLFANRPVRELFGASMEQVIGQTDERFIDAQTAAQVRNNDRQVLVEGKTIKTEEIRVNLKDGRTAVYLSVKLPLRNEVGAIYALCGISTDITERKRAEDALRASEGRLRSLFDGANDGIMTLTPGGDLIAVNESFARMHGYTTEQMQILSLKDLDTPDNSRLMPERMQRLLAGEPLTFEVEHYHKNGHVFPLEVSASLISSDGKQLIQAFHRDITERKRTEVLSRTRLRLSEVAQTGALDELLQVALDGAEEATGSKIGFFHFVDDDQENITLQAWSTNTMKHMCPAEGKGQHYAISAAGVWVDAFHAKGPVIHNDYANLAHKKGMPEGHAPVARELVVPIVRAGKVTEIMGVGNKAGDYVQADVEAVQAIASMVQDLVERIRAETALSESENRLSAVFQASPIGITVSRIEDGKILDVNDAALRLYGYSRDEVIGRTVAELGVYAKPEQREDLVRRLRADGSVRGFWIDFRRKSGEVGVMEVSSRVVELHGEQCLVAMMTDITERISAEKERAALEAQFQQAQKMESVGRLAGGVAHDFNNMLTVIRGNVALAIEQVDPTQPIHADLVEIRKAADRSADLTRQLLAFARRQVIEPKVLDLNQTMAGIVKLLQRLIGEDISLKWVPETNLWSVMADPSQIDQILANLCINARDAIAGVGNIVIETGNSTIDEKYCAAHAGSTPGDFVRIAVSDSGHGIDKEALAHIFEPFFTTKGVGEGTGLGLATVYGAVKQNNGFINVYSEPGTGTTFTIYLPRHVGEAEQEPTSGTAGTLIRGQGTILLVEDEPSILKLTERILIRQGYAVLSAKAPGEAIRLASEYVGTIHLLMTDVVMPEMNGRDLANKLQSSYPGLRVLFMSGYTANIIVHQGVLDQEVQFIQKPFAVDDLAAKVREVLASE